MVHERDEQLGQDHVLLDVHQLLPVYSENGAVGHVLDAGLASLRQLEQDMLLREDAHASVDAGE